MKQLKEGQSLVEILIALSILVIVLVALLSVTVSSLSNTSSAKLQNEATKITQTTIEQIRNYYLVQDWDIFDAACTDNFAGILDALSDSNVFDDENRIVNCEKINEGMPTEGRRVEINISWTDQKGTHQSYLEDYFFDQQSL
jgi:type II secretory pathway pseudopilin PulG